jgi:hypothetical protein
VTKIKELLFSGTNKNGQSKVNKITQRSIRNNEKY